MADPSSSREGRIIVVARRPEYAQAMQGGPAGSPRVLHVITRMNVGGPARHILALMPALRDRGLDTLIAFGSPEPEEGELAPPIGEPSVRIASLRRPIDPAADQRAITDLTRLIRRYRPHVVHTHTAKAGTLGRSAARRVRTPAIVHTFHGHVLEGYFASPANSGFLAVERRLAKRTDALVAVSPATRDDLLELGIGAPERWHVVPYALDLRPMIERTVEPAEARGWLDLPEGVPVVGIVGRLVPIKNHALFLEVATRVAAERPDVVFAIVGDGELRALLEAEARQALADRVRFLGWVDDLPRLYAALDVVVLTSLAEGTPVALIEAMAAGRPVVATDVGGVGAVVDDGVSGLLAPSGDAGGISEAVLRLLEGPALRAGMGGKGRASVAERFSADRMGEAIAELYGELLAGSERRSPRP
jgi:glycosyltransferase involved in cell wall biosynthesis